MRLTGGTGGTPTGDSVPPIEAPGPTCPISFSYRKHRELNIPNTNNPLEGYFSRIKQLLNNQHGLRRWRRYQLIEAILSDSPWQFFYY